ncbi:hypothetical protein INR49_017152 [Caranx melampygus]|nr:hypothetical protein INR49_017152 [Caranx melampygus]
MPPTAPGSHTTISPPATVSMSSSISSLQQMVHGSKASCFSDQSGVQPEKPGPPKLMTATSSVGANSSSAGLVPPLMPISGPSSSAPPGSSLSASASSMSVSIKPSVGSKSCEPVPTSQYQTHAPSAVDTGLSNASTAPSPPGEVNVSSLAAHEGPTVQPLSTLPLLTTHASRTAPVSAPPALVSLPPAMGMSSGVVQSSHSEQHPTLTTTPPRALKQSSPKPEHHGDSEERKAFSNERNGKPEEHLPQLDSGTIRTQKVEVTESHKTEICSDKSFTDLPGKPLQTTTASDQKAKSMDFEKHHKQSLVSDTCETDDSMVEQTPLRKSPQLHSTRIDHLTDEESFDNSACDTPSRMEVSSVLEKTSLLTGDSSCMDDSTQFDSTSHAEGEPSFYTTRDSSFSVEDSRDDTMDSTREGETSEAEETKNSCQMTGESMLESSLNNTAEMEEPPADSNDVTNSQSFVQSQADQQGPEVEWEPRGQDTPDSAGRISIKTTVNEAMTLPSFKMRDENFIAFSTPAESPAVHPLQPVTDQIVPAAAGPLKTPGKPRKPRTPKAMWIKTAPENQRKPRARAPKVEKIKTTEEVTTGRKRKKSLKTDVKEPSDVSGEAGPPTEEVDSITATIEAVLANASALAFEKPKKAKRYLKRHTDSVVSREHFSFSPRMPVGDFYEERETPEGMKWVLLANEEVPSMIMAITGRRGRPPNPDKEKPRRARGVRGGQARRPGRPPKPKMIDLLSKVDAKLLKRLEAKEALTEEEKEKLAKIKKKMKRKLEQEAKGSEMKAEPTDPAAPQVSQPASESAAEPKKPGRRRSVKVEAAAPVRQTDEERIAQGKRVLGARSKAKALAKAQAEAEAAAQAALSAKRAAERRAQAQRRMEERKRQQLIAEELKKPTEDMCLTDHKPLPELSRIPGVVLSGTAFAHCLAVVEFLHGYGKLIGLNIPKDIPSLATLQEGLLGMGDSQGELQDLLIKLSVKILGDKLVELELNRSTISEVLRIFLESHGYETEVCNTLRTKTFHALPPDIKAAILGFLVEELNGSNIAILARRTGRSEEELCFEERRRSARVAEEENLSLEDSVVLERGNRRPRKEEPKLSDSESPTNASIPELERQIDKLTKRQAFFRKSCYSPSGDVLVAEVPVTFLKKEPKVEEIPMPTTPPTTLPSSPSSATPAQGQALSPEEDPLPGTASLMSRPRGRGRPRKIKPEVELHLRTAKIRRRRRSSVRSGGEEGPGSPNSGTHDLTQAAFQSWLSQSQEAVTNGTCSAAGDAPEGNRPEESVKEMAEKQGQWFNLLPKQPCDDNSLTEPQIPASPSSPPKLLPQIPSTLPALAAPLLQPDPLLPGLPSAEPVTAATPQDTTPTAPAPDVPVGTPPLPQLVPAPIPLAPATPAAPAVPAAPAAPAAPVAPFAPTAPTTPVRPARRRRRGSRGSSPARRGPRGAAAKRRGRPPNSVFQELEQQYFTQLVVKPIPTYPIFELKVEQKDVLMEALQQPWQVQEKAMETDISALQWVEDLEQRVVAADLHMKAPPQSAVSDAESNTETPLAEFQPYTIPDPDSIRDDLQYYEHDADPRDDWIVRTKKEWSGLPRIATHPLDLAVLRLANLERNIERRYLKEPLWNPAEVMRLAPLTPTPGEEHPMDVISLESEITSRLRTWRQALDRCRSAPQLCLCMVQLEKAIAWERSVTKVEEGESPRLSKTRVRVKKRRYEDDSSEDETLARRSSGMTTRNKDIASTSSSSRHSGESGSSKRRRMTTRNQPDLTFCEIILMEMEAHADAWPFLEPVNPRLVPGYRRIIKNPMDFLTMRERLLQGGYCSCEEFAADAQLVFNNCELFNEDTSEVGMAGHSMRRFFESRWAEFYSNKDK